MSTAAVGSALELLQDAGARERSNARGQKYRRGLTSFYSCVLIFSDPVRSPGEGAGDSAADDALVVNAASVNLGGRPKNDPKCGPCGKKGKLKPCGVMCPRWPGHLPVVDSDAVVPAGSTSAVAATALAAKASAASALNPADQVRFPQD